jgi:hypothetical protein
MPNLPKPTAPKSIPRHRRPRTRPAGRNALRIALAAVLAGGGVVALADPAAALTRLPCVTAGQQVHCQTTDFSQPFQVEVPDGLTSAHLTLLGGEGGFGATEEVSDRTYLRSAAAPSGGIGGSTTTTLSLTPGEFIDIYVGGPGGNGSGCAGGSHGKSGGLNNGGQGGDGDFDGSLCNGTAGGGGGGGTFAMPHGNQPGAGTPLAAAGGGGGGSGSGSGSPGGVGGKGGGTSTGPSQNGASEGNPTGGGASGDSSHDLQGAGSDGIDGIGCSSPYRASSVTESECTENYGGGGGGGGRYGGHGGDQGEGGGGGSGFAAATPSIQRSAAAFHAAQAGGSFAITFTFPGGNNPNNRPINKGGGPSSNDPNPNTNPEQPNPGDVSRTTTASCEPRIGICHVGPIVGPDSVFNVTARGGTTHADLFGTLQGGSKPDCPNYTEMNGDWLAFGFQDPVAGASWRKLSTLTTRHKLSRPAAVALSRKMQVCFEAPYRFLTRDGYELGGHNAVFDGVLPDCAALGGRSDRGVARPCVASRQILSRHGGWVVRLAFRVPANSKDPKALG